MRFTICHSCQATTLSAFTHCPLCDTKLPAKRQSTTAKVTREAYDTLSDYFRRSCDPYAGFIVRFKGQEYAVLGMFYGKFSTWEGVTLDAKQCTIRKGTIESLQVDMGVTLR